MLTKALPLTRQNLIYVEKCAAGENLLKIYKLSTEKSTMGQKVMEYVFSKVRHRRIFVLNIYSLSAEKFTLDQEVTLYIC